MTSSINASKHDLYFGAFGHEIDPPSWQTCFRQPSSLWLGVYFWYRGRNDIFLLEVRGYADVRDVNVDDLKNVLCWNKYRASRSWGVGSSDWVNIKGRGIREICSQVQEFVRQQAQRNRRSSWSCNWFDARKENIRCLERLAEAKVGWITCN